MATNSTISLFLEDQNKFMTVYCHSDGYLSWNGNILKEYYTTKEKVKQLLSYGEMSSLGSKIEPDMDYPHSFEERQKDVTVYYGRDRGETNVEFEILTGKELFDDLCEYNYVFMNDEWYIIDEDNKEFIKLTDEMIEKD